MLIDICAFVSSLGSRPTTGEILSQLEEMQICSNSQCFESIDDLSTMQTASNVSSNDMYVFALLATALCFLFFNKPKSVTFKSTTPPVDQDDAPVM